MDSSCVVVPGARRIGCGGRFCKLDQGLKSVLKLIIGQTNNAALRDSDSICCNHYSHFKKLISNKCLFPHCGDSENSKSLRKCPANLLIYMNLDKSALVNIHQQCYVQLKQYNNPD